MGGDPHPFYVPPAAVHREEGIVRFPREEARHILRVVRLRAGDVCRVVDGRGARLRVRLLDGSEADLRGDVLEESFEPAPATALELGFPLLHVRARTEWLLEKAVEVGVDRLVPIRWARGLPEGTGARPRWERIVREAMKQCERAWLPELAEAMLPVREEDARMGTRLVLADPEGEPDPPDVRGAARVRLLVGPEGGISPLERSALRDGGALAWSLGPNRLRGETAAIVGAHRLALELRRAD